jgi:hypothetical protein
MTMRVEAELYLGGPEDLEELRKTKRTARR